MSSLFFFIKNTTFRITNFLIGHTPFFIFIFGWFLIITGFLFLTQPEKARKKLLHQGSYVAFGAMRILIIYIALLVLGLGWKFSTTASITISLLVVILLIKLFFSLKKIIFRKFQERFALIPISTLRIYAWGQVIVGTLMLMLGRRIW